MSNNLSITVFDQPSSDGSKLLKITMGLDGKRAIIVHTYVDGQAHDSFYPGTYGLAKNDPARVLRPVDSPKVPKGTCSVGRLGILPESVAKVRPLVADAFDALVSAATDLRAKADADLEAAVPGAFEAIRLWNAYEAEVERFDSEFESMMDDEHNDGAFPPAPLSRSPKEALDAHLGSHPRAAIYLKAYRQDLHAHWADNSGSGSSAKRAMSILSSGGDIEEARKALAVRNPLND